MMASNDFSVSNAQSLEEEKKKKKEEEEKKKKEKKGFPGCKITFIYHLQLLGIRPISWSRTSLPVLAIYYSIAGPGPVPP